MPILDPHLIPTQHLTELGVAWGVCASVFLSTTAAAIAYVNQKVNELQGKTNTCQNPKP